MSSPISNLSASSSETGSVIGILHTYKVITLNPWSISDLELIGIGGFSPLTGFMGEADR
jgi:sulfate adenylyltransferase